MWISNLVHTTRYEHLLYRIDRKPWISNLVHTTRYVFGIIDLLIFFINI